MLIRFAIQSAAPSGPGGRLSILIFHRVLPAPDPLVPDLPDVALFTKCVSWVKAWFNVLPLEEAVTCLKEGVLPARAAAITFDDGYADNLLHASPILGKHGLHATFFIATGFLNGGRMWNDTIVESLRRATEPAIDCSALQLGVLPLGTTALKRAAIGRVIAAVKHLPSEARSDAVARIAEMCKAELPDDLMLSISQLQQLREEGMGIGAHTVTHPILATLTESRARQEIADSREFLEALVGERIRLFAYPNGRLGRDYTTAHARLVESLGFDAAVTTNWGTGYAACDWFQLPRFTPWDKRRWRYGLRLLANLRAKDAAPDPGIGDLFCQVPFDVRSAAHQRM